MKLIIKLGDFDEVMISLYDNDEGLLLTKLVSETLEELADIYRSNENLIVSPVPIKGDVTTCYEITDKI